MSTDSPYRPDFIAALGKIAEACRVLKAAGHPLPILVGGAVVELDTAGAVTSGDFDFVAADDVAFCNAMLAVGFLPEDRVGRLRRGFYLPDALIGVEIVSGSYFDGKGDSTKLRLVDVGSGEVLVAATEDLIADRVGQWVSNKTDERLLNQALGLLSLAENLDSTYLDRRIKEESCGDMDLAALRSRMP